MSSVVFEEEKKRLEGIIKKYEGIVGLSGEERFALPGYRPGVAQQKLAYARRDLEKLLGDE